MQKYSEGWRIEINQKNNKLVERVLPHLAQYLVPGRENKSADYLYKVLDQLMFAYGVTAAVNAGESLSVQLPLTLDAVIELPIDTQPLNIQEALEPFVKLAKAIKDYTLAHYEFNQEKNSFPDARFHFGEREAGVNHAANHLLRKWQKLGVIDYKTAAAELDTEPYDCASIPLLTQIVFDDTKQNTEN